MRLVQYQSVIAVAIIDPSNDGRRPSVTVAEVYDGCFFLCQDLVKVCFENCSRELAKREPTRTWLQEWR
ncbi:hypothetical protein BRADI_5g07172v3 [Brachypodium distachyon]|uniref:Uncharacterized protein n=1 Tax=Brachypodium distachyon TaxID=15368 RepID=A0A2K2CFQ9_BRADI|nr:hypothetical protein BRADI_5g07172v3 [Brachypodium distachyon]